MATADKPASDRSAASATRKASNGAANSSAQRATDATSASSDHPENQGGELHELRLPTIQDIWRAQEVIRPHVYHTPLLPSRTIGAKCGAKVYLKTENLQRSGSYKLRGATYKLSRLTSDERERGVIAASAGNHAQGVAIAAASLGIPCTIVMPTSAPLAKVTATQGYGAQVVLHGATYHDAYLRAVELQEETGATYIHAFDDPDIIAGQGTLGLEILTDLPDVDVIVLGVGGGGLISGVATAVKALKPNVRVIGVEASGAASMRASLDANEIVPLTDVNTIADGIATKSVGRYTFEVARALVNDVVTVSDEEIINAVLLLMERCKLLVEGAGAAGVAALLSRDLGLEGKRVAVVLSGGNIDMNLVGRFIQQGMAAQGRYLVIHTLLPDRPGELLRLLATIAEQNVNVMSVEHHREGKLQPVMHVEVSLTLETRDRAHCDALLDLLHTRGFRVVEEQQRF